MGEHVCWPDVGIRIAIWVALDAASHAIPFLRFGRMRHWICIRTLEAQYPSEQFR